MPLHSIWVVWRFILVAAPLSAAGFAVSGCVTERPGIFYDVRFQAPPPSTLCLDFARAVAERTGLQSSGVSAPVFGANTCQTFLEDRLRTSQFRHVGVLLSTDPTRNLLFVDVCERGYGKPSDKASQLGAVLADTIQASFPEAQMTRGKRFQGPFAP
jgi:hypothetical protein